MFIESYPEQFTTLHVSNVEWINIVSTHHHNCPCSYSYQTWCQIVTQPQEVINYLWKYLLSIYFTIYFVRLLSQSALIIIFQGINTLLKAWCRWKGKIQIEFKEIPHPRKYKTLNCHVILGTCAANIFCNNLVKL